jgi:HAD superfamily hydrolase (TIGR01484 family)
MTPLEFMSNDYLSGDYGVLILTAGGRNSDIRASFTKAAQSEPRCLLGVCMLSDSPLGQIAKKYSFADIAEYDIPSGKDGFLATNSLLAMSVLLARAYIETYDLVFTLPKSFEKLVYPKTTIEQFTSEILDDVKKILNKRTLVILYDAWTKAAAYDMESKFSESGIANTQLADFRNFAHGRHNWLDKNQDDTGIIALTSATSRMLSRSLLDLVPKKIPIVQLNSRQTGPLASLDLLVTVMYIVKFFGDARGIDPGRPGVPVFGRKLYNLKPIIESKKNSRTKLSPLQSVAISRKVQTNARYLPHEEILFWMSAYQTFVRILKKRKFSAVVFDYDGTLCEPRNRFLGISRELAKELNRLLENGIMVGIATGRGKSVRKDLQSKISEKYWSKVYIGYYNCADIGLLNENQRPDVEVPIDASIQRIADILKQDRLFEYVADYEIRPKQISVEPKQPQSTRTVYHYLNNLIGDNTDANLKMMESTHSIDILAPNVSKTNLVRLMREHRDSSSYEVLSIGDKGRWPGNDYFLLSAPNSLSVDTVSANPKTCWNLLPAGCRGEQGAMYYLEHMQPQKGYFQLRI